MWLERIANAGIRVGLELITPERATELIDINTNNRPVKQQVVNYYARSLQQDRWALADSAVVICSGNVLGNGQHRLYAIVESGCSAWMIMAYNVPPECVEYMDDGVVRTMADAHNLTHGLKGKPERLTTDKAAIARLLVSDVRAVKIGRQEALPIYERYKEGIDYSVNCSTRLAVVRAVVARAFYSANRERLDQFLQVLRSGVTVNNIEDYAALKLRDFISKEGKDQGKTVEIYQKTQSALQSFLERRSIVRLNAIGGHLFKLPGESDEQR